MSDYGTMDILPLTFWTTKNCTRRTKRCPQVRERWTAAPHFQDFRGLFMTCCNS